MIDCEHLNILKFADDEVVVNDSENKSHRLFRSYKTKPNNRSYMISWRDKEQRSGTKLERVVEYTSLQGNKCTRNIYEWDEALLVHTVIS